MNHFETPKKAWLAPDSKFSSMAGKRTDSLGNLLTRRNKTDLSQVANYLEDRVITPLFLTDNGYPEQLKNIYDPPPVLFLRGDKDCLNNLSVSLVGSRNASPYGLAVAENLGRDLARTGINVVSGMARGIDTAAHCGALDAGGKTIAVLGCGVDVIYPSENGKVMNNIIKSGAVVSEFPPGARPEPWHFPVRNRVVSGLSKVVVLVEAAKRSGALITANLALEQGRDVMVVPGNITSKFSQGSNGLIKQGAAPVLEVADILEELGVGVIFPTSSGKPSEGLKMNEHEKLLHKLLNYEPISQEILIQKSGLSVGEVMTALMFLEMKGLIKQMPGRLYALVK